MRRLLAVLVLVLLPALVLAPGAAAQMSALETDDLRLVYLDPTQTYLAPWAARCFENSLRFHRKLFDYKPWEKPTVFLMDFADDGNAFATAIPKNFLGVQIAPQSFAYETYPSNERLNTLMNHELVHVAAQDKAAARDRAWRRFFGGKVIETSEHPETIFYDYLTVPRRAAPRWYQEGLAVFIETWMAGGIGRAQGSYDEMVFRSMVRDNSRFYDPLGLASEGTKIDFQLEANSYLYGTRFMSWLAWRYSPELLMRWVSRSDGSKAYYSSQFRQVFGTQARRRVAGLDRLRARVPEAGTSRPSASTPSRPTRTSPRGRSGRSPAPSSIRPRTSSTRPSTTPASSPTSGPSP